MDASLAKLINDGDQLFAVTRDMVAAMPEEKLAEFAEKIRLLTESNNETQALVGVFAFAGLAKAIISARELKDDETGDI